MPDEFVPRPVGNAVFLATRIERSAQIVKLVIWQNVFNAPSQDLRRRERYDSVLQERSQTVDDRDSLIFRLVVVAFAIHCDDKFPVHSSGAELVRSQSAIERKRKCNANVRLGRFSKKRELFVLGKRDTVRVLVYRCGKQYQGRFVNDAVCDSCLEDNGK